MSVAGLLDAMRTDVNPGFRLVWMCLENHANGARWWSTTEAKLAIELHLSTDTVTRAVGWLIGKRIIRVERVKRRPSVFHMLRSYAKAESLTPQNADSTDAPAADHTPQNQGSTVPLTPQNQEPTFELTPQNQESLNPPVRVHQKSPPDSPPTPPTGGEASAVDAIMLAWNGMAKEASLTCITSVNGQRRQHARARLEEHGLDNVLSAIAQVGQSDFLCGSGNRGFRASFDWLMKPSNFVKVLEGNYAVRHRKPAFDPDKLTGAARALWNLEQERAALAQGSGQEPSGFALECAA